MALAARRVFRLALVTALALLLGYGLQMPLPFLAPVFALMLSAPATPPPGLKGLLALVLLLLLTLGIGLLLIPLLRHYPLAGLLLVALGLFLSFHITVAMGKALVGLFLAAGMTLISAVGVASFALAVAVIQALIAGLVIAVLCQWLVYPWLPEDGQAKARPQHRSPDGSLWIAARATLIMLPVYLLALSNPPQYLPTIMKSVSLSQQASLLDAAGAGRELLGSTFLAGCCAILFWSLLGIATNLWMFFWLMLAFGIYIAAKFYRVLASRFGSGFWLNTATTTLILLGPAVADSESGKDVYSAFLVRMGLFVAVTLYAWLAIYLLEAWRARRTPSALSRRHAAC
jgi:hypothetical protein